MSTDNIAALTLCAKLKSKSRTLGIIGREMALDIADAIYEPDIVQHIPGLTNLLADCLSRRFDSNASFTLPTALKCAKEVHPERRAQGWWRSLADD